MEGNSLVSGPGVQSKGLRKKTKRIVPACYRQTDLFYGDYSDLREEPQKEKLEREWKAKRVCSQCELILPCRTFALRTDEEYGVWGGMTPGERREFLKWYKVFYSRMISLTDEQAIDTLVKRWRERHRKKQNKKESQLPRHYGSGPKSHGYRRSSS